VSGIIDNADAWSVSFYGFRHALLPLNAEKVTQSFEGNAWPEDITKFAYTAFSNWARFPFPLAKSPKLYPTFKNPWRPAFAGPHYCIRPISDIELSLRQALAVILFGRVTAPMQLHFSAPTSSGFQPFCLCGHGEGIAKKSRFNTHKSNCPAKLK
jgi:hypothetical protein